MAKKIAFWHGQKMIYRNQDGMQTVASSHGYGNWADSADRYTQRHWHEYVSAAEQILEDQKEVVGRLKAQIDGVEDALRYVG